MLNGFFISNKVTWSAEKRNNEHSIHHRKQRFTSWVPACHESAGKIMAMVKVNGPNNGQSQQSHFEMEIRGYWSYVLLRAPEDKTRTNWLSPTIHQRVLIEAMTAFVL